MNVQIHEVQRFHGNLPADSLLLTSVSGVTYSVSGQSVQSDSNFESGEILTIGSGATLVYASGASLSGNLSELRSDLGLGTAATHNVGVKSGQVPVLGEDGILTASKFETTEGGVIYVKDLDGHKASIAAPSDFSSDKSMTLVDKDGYIPVVADSNGLVNLSSEVVGSLGEDNIADDAVTNGKLAEVAQATIKGRPSGAGTGNPQDLTANQVMTVLATATSPPVTSSTQKIRQVVLVTPKTDTASGSNTAPTWAVVYSGSIVTTAADSKVVVLCFFNAGSDGGYYIFARLERAGTPLQQGDTAGDRVRCATALFPPHPGSMLSATILGWDTPGSIDTHQYDLALAANVGSNWHLNRSLLDQDINERPRAITSMILIEVAP